MRDLAIVTMESIVNSIEWEKKHGMTSLSVRESDSVVWLQDGKIFKSQPKHQTDNEFHFLTTMKDSGYVPVDVVREGVEKISMEYIVTEGVTDEDEFLSHYQKVLAALHIAGIRHGDLTEYAVLVRNNKPVIIDFGESREWWSKLPSKRPEPDSFWLARTMEKLSGGHKAQR